MVKPKTPLTRLIFLLGFLFFSRSVAYAQPYPWTKAHLHFLKSIKKTISDFGITLLCYIPMPGTSPQSISPSNSARINLPFFHQHSSPRHSNLLAASSMHYISSTTTVVSSVPPLPSSSSRSFLLSAAKGSAFSEASEVFGAHHFRGLRYVGACEVIGQAVQNRELNLNSEIVLELVKKTKHVQEGLQGQCALYFTLAVLDHRTDYLTMKQGSEDWVEGRNTEKLDSLLSRWMKRPIFRFSVNSGTKTVANFHLNSGTYANENTQAPKRILVLISNSIPLETLHSVWVPTDEFEVIRIVQESPYVLKTYQNQGIKKSKKWRR